MPTLHSVWKSQKKSYSTLRAKRATFTFWMDKSSLKSPKNRQFGNFKWDILGDFQTLCLPLPAKAPVKVCLRYFHIRCIIGLLTTLLLLFWSSKLPLSWSPDPGSTTNPPRWILFGPLAFFLKVRSSNSVGAKGGRTSLVTIL